MKKNSATGAQMMKSAWHRRHGGEAIYQQLIGRARPLAASNL